MFQLQILSKQKGVTVIEIVVAVAILTIAFAGVMGLISFSIVATSVASQNLKATILAEGAIEALRNYRDGILWDDDDPSDEYDGLGVVSVGVAYHPELSGGLPARWKFVQGVESVDIFQRSVLFENVERNAEDTIIESGGVVDLNTKKVIVTVSWQERGRSHSVELVSYFTNWNK